MQQLSHTTLSEKGGGFLIICDTLALKSEGKLLRREKWFCSLRGDVVKQPTRRRR